MGAECIEEPSHHLEALDVILKPNLTRHDVSAEAGPLGYNNIRTSAHDAC